MPHCVALGCTVGGGYAHKKPADVSFHFFPQDPERLDLWIKRVRRKDWLPSKISVLCSRHFEEDCFDPRFGGRKKRLTGEAVPTVFDYYRENTRKRKVLLDDYFSYHDGPAICLCGYEASNLPDLAIHAEEERCQVYRCNCCDYLTHVRSLLLFHKRTKRYGCELCEFDSESQGGMVAHMTTEHRGKNNKKSFNVEDERDRIRMTCPHCKIVYKNLEKHMQDKHNFGCELCTYRTKNRRLLRRHLKLKHAGDIRLVKKEPKVIKTTAKIRNHRCHICDFGATSKTFLQNHLERVHGEEEVRKMFRCEHCDYSTQFSSNVVVHMRRQHEDLKGRYFSCDDCSYWTISEEGMEQHVSLKHGGIWQKKEKSTEHVKAEVLLQEEEEEDGIVRLDSSSNLEDEEEEDAETCASVTEAHNGSFSSEKVSSEEAAVVMEEEVHEDSTVVANDSAVDGESEKVLFDEIRDNCSELDDNSEADIDKETFCEDGFGSSAATKDNLVLESDMEVKSLLFFGDDDDLLEADEVQLD